MDIETEQSTDLPVIVLRLYVVGNSPKSVQAMANLELICKQAFQNNHEIQIIDVLDDPLRMLADGITITPMLVKASPPPVVKLFGDLSDRDMVVLALSQRMGRAHG